MKHIVFWSILILLLLASLYLIFRAEQASFLNTGSVRKILVLDLDETLIHTDIGSDDKYLTTLRPYVTEFLAHCHSELKTDNMKNEIVLFTAGVKGYADSILELLDPKGALFSRRFYRHDCSIVNGSYVKDLRKVYVHASDRVCIIDNTPTAYSLQPHLGVPIKDFLGDPNDRELLGYMDWVSQWIKGV